MVNMKSITSKRLKTAAVIALALVAGPVFAQSADTTGLCKLVSFIKSIIGTVAVLAILLYVINSFFGKSALIGEIIEKVLIGCVVAVGATFLVTKTGLVVSCSSGLI